MRGLQDLIDPLDQCSDVGRTLSKERRRELEQHRTTLEREARKLAAAMLSHQAHSCEELVALLDLALVYDGGAYIERMSAQLAKLAPGVKLWFFERDA